MADLPEFPRTSGPETDLPQADLPQAGLSPAEPLPADVKNGRGVRPARIAVIGGGLAGLAASASLSTAGHHVHLFESRRHWGGRAGSYCEREGEEWIDHCQHVAMGCCTNFLHLCRQLGVGSSLRRDRVLTFLGPDGRSHRFAATRGLPAPLHLGPALLRLSYLGWGDKLRIAQAMWNLLRSPSEADSEQAERTVAEWLSRQKQTAAAVERFWGVVLISALGETLDRASFAAARKVFLDGFLAARSAYELWIPTIPLDALYRQMIGQLERQGVATYLGTRVDSVAPISAPQQLPSPIRDNSASRDAGTAASRETHSIADWSRAAGSPASQQAMGWSLRTPIGSSEFDGVIVAVPWRRLKELWDGGPSNDLPHVAIAEEITSSPITAVHLWFDRPLFSMPHAVIVGRLSQWVFRRVDGAVPLQGDQRSHVPTQSRNENEHYYQVVISASRELAGRPRESIRDEVLADLKALWPSAHEAQLLRWRVVSQADAVFSITPWLESKRPGQRTPFPRLAVAGDWTKTGWPSTMEGAVRSGYLAAEAILHQLGQPARILQPDLPQSWLTRLLSRAM